ncbi:MAG: thioredoxin [Chloroflexi bacterium RBG_16_54_18]|nr:MAG: thioredoxin [Chloroflexi bacterium RBG_16_54_18]
MMADILKLNEGDFQVEVLEASLPVLVDFTAAWCAPCKMLEPVVQQLAAEWQDKVKVVRLDVDDHPLLAMDYQVMGVPTLMLFKNGKPVERLTGFQPKDRLVKKFFPYLN